MKQVASLQYGVIFKKAFCDVEIFKGFVKAVLGIDLEIDTVETEKSFDPVIGNVDLRFDLYAQDEKIASLSIFNIRKALTITIVFCIITARQFWNKFPKQEIIDHH